MEFNGRVYLNCPGAPNPYHECSSKCLESLISGEGIKEKKKFATAGQRTPGRSTPVSPAHVTGDKSPLRAYYYERKVDADDALSFSSSDENSGFFWKQTSPAHAQSLQKNPVSAKSTPDRRSGGTSSDLCSHPRTPETRPRTPEPMSRMPGRRKTPDPRSRTPEPRPRTLEARPRTPGRPRTPEPRPRTLEPLSRTPGRPRTPETRPRTPRSHENYAVPGATLTTRVRSPPPYFSSETKAYSEDTYPPEEEDILFYPEILLSPAPKPSTSRPATPNHLIVKTPSKPEVYEEKIESDDSDCFSFVEDQSVYLFPEIIPSSEAKPTSGSSTPVNYIPQIKNHEKYQEQFEPPELLDEFQRLSLLDISRMREIKNCNREEENQSVMSQSFVSVGNYKVRSSVSSTLLSILDKYGDIAAESKLQSLSTRSYYLESLSSVVLELKSSPLKDLTETRINEMLSMVKDMGSVKIEVGWLLGVLDELLQAVKHFSHHKAAMVEREGCDRDLEAARKDIEALTKVLGVKEKELGDCREKVTETGARLSDLQMKRSRLSKNSHFLKSKVEKFQGKSVLDELL